ncbi:hypothetical protein QBC38DRAFT_491952 [Podospora fimiseda]|uniref:Secreted protein n=1 Tax=Podospora fimiseda TaxID=252190 RepID=A0AAN6YLH8_9PEZI|nr:hypothetical protein QBC38DRAFT_491952 [Podospora fimiseda]
MGTPASLLLVLLSVYPHHIFSARSIQHGRHCCRGHRPVFPLVSWFEPTTISFCGYPRPVTLQTAQLSSTFP